MCQLNLYSGNRTSNDETLYHDNVFHTYCKGPCIALLEGSLRWRRCQSSQWCRRHRWWWTLAVKPAKAMMTAWAAKMAKAAMLAQAAMVVKTEMEATAWTTREAGKAVEGRREEERGLGFRFTLTVSHKFKLTVSLSGFSGLLSGWQCKSWR
jgi:hypothetical protein